MRNLHTHSLNVVLNPGNNGSSDELLTRMKPFKEECILKIVDIYKGLSIFTFILAYASYSHKTIVSCFVKTGVHVQSFFHKENGCFLNYSIIKAPTVLNF